MTQKNHDFLQGLIFPILSSPRPDFHQNFAISRPPAGKISHKSDIIPFLDSLRSEQLRDECFGVVGLEESLDLLAVMRRVIGRWSTTPLLGVLVLLAGQKIRIQKENSNFHERNGQ